MTRKRARQRLAGRCWRRHPWARTMADLLSISDLPAGFEYPSEFVRVVELGVTNLEPWWVIEGDVLRDRLGGLRKRYETRVLVPFARRQDNDHVVCCDVDRGLVVTIHDFAAPGWEQREEFSDLYAWLRRAVEDLIAFE
jgi:hypothetical protein